MGQGDASKGEKAQLIAKDEKKSDLTLQMALFCLMVVMSSLEPIISKLAVPEADAKKPFRPGKSFASPCHDSASLCLHTRTFLVPFETKQGEH